MAPDNKAFCDRACLTGPKTYVRGR